MDILLRKFKANAIGVLVTIIGVVNRKGNACCPLMLGGDCFAQIGSEGCDATPARQIVADKCYSPDNRAGCTVLQKEYFLSGYCCADPAVIHSGRKCGRSRRRFSPPPDQTTITHPSIWRMSRRAIVRRIEIGTNPYSRLEGEPAAAG